MFVVEENDVLRFSLERIGNNWMWFIFYESWTNEKKNRQQPESNVRACCSFSRVKIWCRRAEISRSHSMIHESSAHVRHKTWMSHCSYHANCSCRRRLNSKLEQCSSQLFSYVIKILIRMNSAVGLMPRLLRRNEILTLAVYKYVSVRQMQP